MPGSLQHLPLPGSFQPSPLPASLSAPSLSTQPLSSFFHPLLTKFTPTSQYSLLILLILSLCHHLRLPVSPLHLLCVDLLHITVTSTTKYIHQLLQLPVPVPFFEHQHHSHLIQKWCVSLHNELHFIITNLHPLLFAGGYDTASQCSSESSRRDTCS